MAAPLTKSSFAAGELAPALWGRIDLAKYAIGCSTMRNVFVNYKGGASSRAGTKYVGTSPQPATLPPPRLIKFQFNLNQGFVLEFGNLYMRVIYQGAYVESAPNVIFSLTTPWAAADIQWLKFTQSADVMTLCCVNQTTGTEYPPYDLARITNSNWTLTETTFSASISAPNSPTVTAQSSDVATTYYSYVVTAVNSNTGEESVASLPGSVENNNISLSLGSNTISWDAVPGATSYNVYGATPSVSLSVPVSSLYGFLGTALGTTFVDTNITADFTVVPPTHSNPFSRGAITDVLPTAGGINYDQSTISYSVTTSTGSGFSGVPVVTNGSLNGFVIYNQGSGYQASDTISFSDSGGGLAKTIATFSTNPADTNVVKLNGVQVNFSAAVVFPTTPTYVYTHIESTLALTLQTLANTLNASNLLSLSVATYTASGDTLTITYKTPGTVGNAYTLDASTAPVTFSTGTALAGGGTDGSGATANLIVGPENQTYPGGAAYFQQRRYYFNTLNQPDTYFGSKPGIYTNMDSSIPTVDSDALVGTPWAQQINGIQAMVPMPGGNIILTGAGAWQLSGGGTNQAVTPANQIATPQAYNGCNATVPPIPIDYDVLYVQAKGAIVRDLTYNFFVNIYTGNDKTQFSSHLFTGYEIVQWAYSEEPYKVVWAVRNDGVLLSMTYLKSEDISGWARHDTNGLFVGVCSVTEPPVDAVYFVVQRYINNEWVYYIERADNRLWTTAEDAWCVDAGLSYPQNEPNATLTVSAPVATLQTPNVIAGGIGYSSLTYAEISDKTGTGAILTLTIAGGIITGAALSGTLTGYTHPTVKVIDPQGLGGGGVISLASLLIATATASVGVFSDTAGNGQIGDVIRSGGGIATVTQYVSATQLTVQVTQPFTAVLQNNLAKIPVPQTFGNWSIINPVTTVSGLGHLNGQTVSILADGGVVPQKSVSNGQVILPQPASQIIVGLPFTAQLQTLYLDIPGANPTVQGRRKMIQGVTLRTDASRGLYVGVNQPDASAQPGLTNVPWTDMVPVSEMTPFVLPGQPIPLKTGDTYTHFPSDWDAKGQMAFQITDPLPMNLDMISAEITLGDDPGP